MFEVAELGQTVGKNTYNARVPDLRHELLQVQETLKEADFPVLIVISGVDGAGKGETINLLNEWMDPRYLRTYAFGAPTEDERQRPPFWRFWSSLPPRGLIGLYVGSWYSDIIAHRVADEITDADLDARLLRVKSFEKMLVDDGALIIKFWLHLSKAEQKKRLKSLEKDPETAWRVTDQDRKHLKLYGHFRDVAERTLRETSTGEAPWTIVEGSDPRYRHLTVGEHILQRLSERLEREKNGGAAPMTSARSPVNHTRTILSTLDLSLQLGKRDYKAKLKQQQERLARLNRAAREKKISSVLLLEGWDAAGKGGIIRRIVPAIDARAYQIIPIAAPTDEEKAHHYLWRFWRHIPRAGMVTIYDRSWYGRVLVERIEGFTPEPAWMRAYAEINDFEEQLTERSCAASRSARRSRSSATRSPMRTTATGRSGTSTRRRSMTWSSAEYAPWTLIEGNDKHYARVKALTVFCDRLEAALDGAAPD